MKVHYSLDTFSAKNPVVTIGMFDGVHSGHRKILEHLEQEKVRLNGESVVITFEPHPRIFFNATEHFNLLSTIDQKLELLAQTGIDHCIIIPFTKEFSALEPEEYVHSVLYKGIGCHTIIIGYDHRFGRKGSGDYALLEQLGIQYGFNTQEIPAFDIDEINVSSTKIREALLSGNIAKANSYLTYSYFIEGAVTEGKKIGRTIGVPTANMVVEDPFKLIPAQGIYAVEVIYKNVLYKGVVSIGTNPSINVESKVTIEVHIFNFSEDIYGENIRILFKEWIRSQVKFDSIEELQTAIFSDIEIAKKILA